jgi:hypothetical protein
MQVCCLTPPLWPDRVNERRMQVDQKAQSIPSRTSRRRWKMTLHAKAYRRKRRMQHVPCFKATATPRPLLPVPPMLLPQEMWPAQWPSRSARYVFCDLVHVSSFADAAEPKMQALSERTGAHIVTFMTRGHVDDQVTPAWFASSGAAHFFMDALKLSAWDILRLFEQWACARSSSMLLP